LVTTAGKLLAPVPSKDIVAPLTPAPDAALSVSLPVTVMALPHATFVIAFNMTTSQMVTTTVMMFGGSDEREEERRRSYIWHNYDKYADSIQPAGNPLNLPCHYC
jgi:hypothetical protein